MDSLREQIQSRGWTIREPVDADDFKVQLRRAMQEPFERIVLAGGDGTLHSALNALDGPNRTPLALLPLGTGNDWARTTAVPLDPLAALPLVVSGRVKVFDTIRIRGDETSRLLNAATGGFAGEVTGRLSDERKSYWGPLAYLREAGAVAVDPPQWSITVRFDGGQRLRYDVINVVVANGRTAGGGIPVAPTANAQDGRLDVLLVMASDAFDRTVITARVLAGDYDRDELVLHRRAKSFELTSDTDMTFSFDGETVSGKYFHFAVEPKNLRFVVGPEYHQRGPRRRFVLLGWLFDWFGRFLRLFRRA